MARQLIINADDYGLTRGVSRGIREAHQAGIVTSTTAMMNIPGVENDLRLALDETPQLGLGVHLVLTAGYPIVGAAEARTLVSATGEFLNLVDFTSVRGELVVEEVRAEWTAQIERFISVTGRAPDHLDSHHHSSFFTAALFRAFLELAREYHCAVRSLRQTMEVSGLPSQVDVDFAEFAAPLIETFVPRTTDLFCADFYDQGATREGLLASLDKLPGGSTELMCHPGYADEALAAASSYISPRETELTVLIGPSARQAIATRRIELISFGDLKG
jgi:predicted glycoside hydrolase/deacetylase ChbG (UPF0249 family)